MKPVFKNKTILITGASSGMGRLLAKSLASEAKDLILVARRENELDVLAAEIGSDFAELMVYTIPCDLADINNIRLLTNKVRYEIIYVVSGVITGTNRTYDKFRNGSNNSQETAANDFDFLNPGKLGVSI